MNSYIGINFTNKTREQNYWSKMNTGLDHDRAKKIITKDHNGNDNGYIMEIKNNDHKTFSHLTSANPGYFKGFHVYLEIDVKYICIKGELTVTVYTGNMDYSARWFSVTKHEVQMKEGDTLFVPALSPTALKNTTDKQAMLIRFPATECDSSYLDEQIEFAEDEILTGKFVDFLNRNK